MSTNSNEPSGSKLRNPELFKASIKNLVEEIASGVSQEEFQKILKTLAEKPSVVPKLYDMQTSAIITELHQDVDYLFAEYEIDKKYNEITRLMQQSPEDKNAWRPATGDCNAQLHSYRLKSLIEKKEKLEHLIQKDRIVRMLAKTELDKKRDVFRNRLANISSAKAELNNYYYSLPLENEII